MDREQKSEGLKASAYCVITQPVESLSNAIYISTSPRRKEAYFSKLIAFYTIVTMLESIACGLYDLMTGTGEHMYQADGAHSATSTRMQPAGYEVHIATEVGNNQIEKMWDLES
jgi:hypothetical protein